MKADELRSMSEEQLELTLKETTESLFRLHIQSQTERLDAPSELRRHKRLVARIKTIKREREMAVAAEAVATGAEAAAAGAVDTAAPETAAN